MVSRPLNTFLPVHCYCTPHISTHVCVLLLLLAVTVKCQLQPPLYGHYILKQEVHKPNSRTKPALPNSNSAGNHLPNKHANMSVFDF